MQCTIEIFDKGKWQKCCIVKAEDASAGRNCPSILMFDRNWPANAKPAPSLRYSPQSDPLELSSWPSFLLDLIPQGAGRKHLVEELNLPDDPRSDWSLLLTGAICPIGRIRVREAAAGFEARMRELDPKLVSQGFTTQEVLSRSEAFAEYFEAHGFLSAGATSVQGTTPKLLLTQGRDDLWYADAALPDEKAAKHYILKFSRARNLADWHILRNEAAYMQLAKEMGLFVEEPPEWRNEMLFVPRFDRKVTQNGVMRYHQESLASLAGLTDPSTPVSHFSVLETLRQYVHDPFTDTLEYIRRDIMNLALGNPDNCPFNTAVQTVNGMMRLSPLYDFAPMYLDMDEMERSIQWLDENGNVLTNWADVLRALPLESYEKDALRTGLRTFGEKMKNIEPLMEKFAAGHDIMTDRYYGIQNQRWQLREL